MKNVTWQQLMIVFTVLIIADIVTSFIILKLTGQLD
jgi:hypothetical protein